MKQLAYATVIYWDSNTKSELEVGVFFRFLPRKGDRITIYTSQNKTISRRVRSVEHILADVRSEQDIIIRTECD